MSFKSSLERSVDIQLRQSGVEYSYESLKIPFTLSRVYNPDFILANGIIIEAKGVLSVDDRQKMRAVKDQHPTLDIRFLFQREDTRVKHGKMTNEQWASRNEIPFAVSQIPGGWFE